MELSAMSVEAELIGRTSRRPLAEPALHDRLVLRYRSIFSVSEIDNDIILKWMAGAILLGFHVTFLGWIYSPLTTIRALTEKTWLCWPFFQSCGGWIFLETLPDGYSQTMVYMALFGLGLMAIVSMYGGKWTRVHFIIFIMFICKLYFMLINYEFNGNFDYYHNLFCLAYLLVPHKVFFLRLSVVFFYFLATVSKIHPSWVLGQYFTALKTGLPIFPFGTEILMTNLVIFMEMVASWFLFSRNIALQRVVFAFFVTFHLYSGIIVGYRYPTIVVPPLLILFGPWFEAPKEVPVNLRSLAGWSLMAILLGAQFIPKMISGDEKLTLEGNFYGLYMFEANHQCYGHITHDDSIVKKFSYPVAQYRCDPYNIWFRARNEYCSDPNAKYGMVFNHSINGGPFKQTVNEENICDLEYRPFGRNAWIKDENDAPAVARPVKNICCTAARR
jgi:hypothetical protein